MTPTASASQSVASAAASSSDQKNAAMPGTSDSDRTIDVVCYGVGSSLATNLNAQLQLCALLALFGIQSATFNEHVMSAELRKLMPSAAPTSSTASTSSSGSGSSAKRHKKKKESAAAATTSPATASAAPTVAASVAPLATRVFLYEPLLSALEIDALTALVRMEPHSPLRDVT